MLYRIRLAMQDESHGGKLCGEVEVDETFIGGKGRNMHKSRRLYVSVAPFHLFRYVDEQVFRFNNREPMDDAHRFSYVIRKIVGKRPAYKELIGKEGETEPESASKCLNAPGLRLFPCGASCFHVTSETSGTSASASRLMKVRTEA